MDIPKTIAGLDALLVRELFLKFLDQSAELKWDGGVPRYKARRMNSDFIEHALELNEGEARRICSELVAEGWLDREKLTPTRKGMALSHHIDRPRLPRSEAEAILEEVVDWAERTNATPDERVRVKAIHLYGSLERGEIDVGDIDLFVEFTTMDLGDEMLPEDFEREEELALELSKISEYLSPSSALDKLTMDDVATRQVFPRINS